MKEKIMFTLGLLTLFIFLFISFVSSQEESESLWIWGEVTEINYKYKQIKIKYLDYETDTEEEMSFDVDENAKIEGVNSFIEIKPNDIVSIDYIVKDNKNIARIITVEKLDDAPSKVMPLKNNTSS